MFEFEKEAGDLSDYTLVLPAVSVGNVGEFSAFLVFFLFCFGSEARTGGKNFYRRTKYIIYRRPTLYPLEIAVDFLKSL